MIKAHRRALCALLFAPVMAASAGEVAGMVKTVSGEVIVQRGTHKFPATVGAPVELADRIRTYEGAAVGVTLRDDTLLSAGANSTLVIDRFAYDSTTSEGRMTIGVRRGTLSVASGRIARRAPESVEFLTPTSTLGVRGTEFIIDVGDGKDD